MNGTADEEKKWLKEDYDKLIDLAESEFDQTKDELQKFSLSIAIDASWYTVDDLALAVRDLDGEDKSRIYSLFREVLSSSSRVYRAKIKRLTQKGNRCGGVKREIKAAVDAAINDELARCPPDGPVNLGRVADELQTQGIQRGWRSLHRQLEKRGVVLPTTAKRKVSPAGRHPLNHDRPHRVGLSSPCAESVGDRRSDIRRREFQD